ncbi:unnamed protein product [Linum tenue]|uniref:Uncharacterized protein n=1 Tax=Linum tenue TaxID=586396 RepID=A0AAV0HQH3_9ROSI|nr:unnamed protein product [Linum tenue]
MNAVDSALDPLVFDYISCSVSDILNNLWTWVAVLTAAVSFWRIRTAAAAGEAAPSTPPRNSSSSILRLTLHVPAPPFVLHRKTRSAAAVYDEVQTEAPVSTPKTPASSPIVCDDDDVVTKGKFVAYYREEVEVEEEEVVGGGDNGGDGSGWWETELRAWLGRGELGWYKYQDLTAINGNVVRLWDGGRSGDGESYDGSSKCNPRCCLVW